MNVEAHDWLDPRHQVTIAELAAMSGLQETELRELVDFGALVPAEPGQAQWTFTADCVVTVRKATRLRTDLELDSGAFALAVRFLRRIDELEGRIAELRARQMGAWPGR